MENVHYIAYYGKLDNHRNLYIYPAAVAKASYVISALKQVGYKVTVLSTAGTKNRYSCRYRRYEKEIDDQETIIYVDSFGSKHKLLRGCLKMWILLQLFHYLMVFVKPNDKVVVYHSTSYKWPLLAARALKKFYLIFEVEEVYAASFGKSKKRQDKEIKYLNKGDAYILVNDLMANKFNIIGKPFIVAYGSYFVPKVIEAGFEDENIHVVYAGIVDKIKLGAFLAVESAEYLTKGYKVHILGFGSENSISELHKLITEVNKKIGFENVIYEGSMYGEEYTKFLSKCKIGLSANTMEGDFVDLTFPSKLLVYLGHNIIPVCSPIPCVEKSRIANSVVFYNKNTPEAVAETIMSIDVTKRSDLNKVLIGLDADFVVDLGRLMEIACQKEKVNNGEYS